MQNFRSGPTGFYVLFCNPTFVAVASAMIVLYCMTRTDTFLAKALNTRVLTHIGVLSYSLYLWQQMFMSETAHVGWLGYGYAFGIAEASYWFVEQPSLRLRSLWEPRLFGNRRATPIAQSQVR